MIIGNESAVLPELQRVSKALFGNQDRLVVAAAIAEAEAGDMFAQRIAELLSITDNRVGLQIAALETAGLVTRLPKVGSERRVYLERTDSSFWELCVTLCRELGA